MDPLLLPTTNLAAVELKVIQKIYDSKTYFKNQK